jgi:hypothetical protein
MNTLILLQALWTFQCNTVVCDFDARSSTGTIKSAVWNFGDSTRTSSGVQVRHTYEKAGTYKVLLKVYDGAKYSQLTKTIVVYAQPVRVDTVFDPETSHDTLLLPSKPDTEYVVRTAWLHDTVAYAITAPPTSMVDSLAIPNGYTVYRAELAGVILKRDGKYAAQVSSACPASMVPPPPLKMALFCPLWSYGTRDSAVTRILTTP